MKKLEFSGADMMSLKVAFSAVVALSVTPAGDLPGGDDPGNDDPQYG